MPHDRPAGRPRGPGGHGAWWPWAASATATCWAPARLARTIRFNNRLSDQFLLARPDTFALGVCNGCQMMAAGAHDPRRRAWPRFTRTPVRKYEARLALVELAKSPSIFFAGMDGARIPVAVARRRLPISRSRATPAAC